MKGLNIIILFLVIVFSKFSNAGCTYDGGYVWRPQVSLGNIQVQRDAPVGSVIATTRLMNSDKSAGCTANSARYRTLTYLGGLLSGVAGVYNTNLPGVGIQVVNQDFTNPATIWSGYSANYYATHHDMTVNLIKTGNITPGALTPGEIANEKFDGDNSTLLLTEVISMGSGNNVSVQACSIKSSAIQINLEHVLNSDLSSIGASAKPRSFELGLNCNAGANINLRLMGNKNTDVSTDGILQLTNQGAADVATGVAIQILYNNSPVVIGNNMVLKRSAGGDETFPFIAQYYQTKTSPGPGRADATATFELTYQ